MEIHVNFAFNYDHVFGDLESVYAYIDIVIYRGNVLTPWLKHYHLTVYCWFKSLPPTSDSDD